VADREHELTVRSGRDADRPNTRQATEVALEAGDARDAHEPRDDDLGRRRL
jgi:hypothetical protein